MVRTTRRTAGVDGDAARRWVGGRRGWVAGLLGVGAAMALGGSAFGQSSQPPTVGWLAPSGGTSFVTGTPATLVAAASDVDGTVASVDFFVDGAFVANGTNAGDGTFSAVWIPQSAGTFALTAVATDDGAQATTSAALGVSTTVPPTPAARCTTVTQGSQLKSGLLTAVGCNQQKLLQGPSYVCPTPSLPACAGNIVSPVVALAHGVNTPPASAVTNTLAGVRRQIECQNEIARGIANYIGEKVYQLTQGSTVAQAEVIAQSFLPPITTKCATVVIKQDASGVVLPSVGAPCALGAVGTTMDPAGLRTCLAAESNVLLAPIANFASPVVSLVAPTSGASLQSPFDLLLTATATDADSSITQLLFEGDNGAVLGLGALTGGSYVLDWPNVPPGAHAVTAIATDSEGMVTRSAPAAITVAPPLPLTPPSAAIIAPADGSVYSPSASIPISVAASDLDGFVVSVDYYADTTYLGSGLDMGDGTFDFVWSSPPMGAFQVFAVATDDDGGTTSTPAVTLYVTPAALSVSITSPADGTSMTTPPTLPVTITVQGEEVASVEVYADAVLLGSAASQGGETYGFAWASPPPGDHQLTAIAYNVENSSATSAPVDLTLLPSSGPPTIVLTSPTAGASLVAGTPVLLGANASDVGGGAVTQVDFLIDGVLASAGVHGGNGAFSTVWLPSAAGSYSLTAVATDDDSSTTTSSSATLVVSGAPTAAPRCTTTLEGAQFKSTVKTGISCNHNKLVVPGYVCPASSPPACSGNVVSQAKALAHGANDPPASAVVNTLAGVKAQLDCQGEIAKAVYNYMGDKINLLTQGQTPAQAEAQAATWFAPIATKCTNTLVKQDVSGVVLPAVGAACQSHVGGVGSVVNEPALTACLRSAADALLTPIAKYAAPTVAMTAPANGSSYPMPADLLLSATAADADGTVAVVNFRDNGALLGQGTLTGGAYSFSWLGAPPGAHAVTADAVDSNGLVTTSTAVVVGVTAPLSNAAPAVAISAPESGASTLAPATWDLVATASDNDGSVAAVTFYANGISLGAASPLGGGSYGLTWATPLGGMFTLTAVAVDELGASTTSLPVFVSVQSPPSVQLASPVDGASYLDSATITFAAIASDADGHITSVDFYVDGIFAASGTSTASSYTVDLTGFTSGAHAVHAIATDNAGLTTATQAVSFTVLSAPTVAITAPSAGAPYTTTDAVTIVAATTAGYGTLTAVDFFIDGALAGAGVHGGNGLYSYVWASPTAGTHSLTVTATNSAGLSTTSAPVAISVTTATTQVLCTQAEVLSMKTVLIQANNCNFLRHVYGPNYACTVGAPPACAPTVITDLMGLTWGPNYPPLAQVQNNGAGVQAQLACQSEIGKATNNYFGTVVQSLVTSALPKPAVADANAVLSFNTIDQKCNNVVVKQDVSGVVLPAVGAACQSYVGNPGAVVNVAGLKSCLHQTAKPWTKPLSYRRPTITFGAPAPGQAFTHPALVEMVLQTSDLDGTVVQVLVAADGVTLGNATMTPGDIYTYSWAAPGGAHALTATAVDSDGMTTTTGPRLISMISAPTGAPPAVAVVSPTSNDAFEAPATIHIDVTASDADGSVAQVDVYANGAHVGAALSLGGGLYTTTWSNARAGTHNITAIATDDDGNRSVSAVARARVDHQHSAGRCATTTEADDLAQALSDALEANEAILIGGSGGSLTAPPSCSGGLVFDAVRLAYGPNDPPAAAVDMNDPVVAAAQACQSALAQAIVDYTTAKTTALVTGTDEGAAHASSSVAFDSLVAPCDGITVVADAGGVVLPQVGRQCAGAMGAVGSPVDGVALRDCLSSLVDVWTNRVGPAPQPLRPNILFIITDDQRQDTTGPTHNITSQDLMWRTRQQLAGGGMEFPNAFLTTPLCGPSRASVLSGQYSNHHGVRRNLSPYGVYEFVETSTLATWLQSTGYRTGLFGKYINGYSARWKTPSTPYIPPGWTTWSPMKDPSFFAYNLVENGVSVYYGNAAADYSTDVLRERAKSFMQASVAAGQPFFAWVGFYAPHAPFTPAPRHAGLLSANPLWRPLSFNEADVSDKPQWVQDNPPLSASQISVNDSERQMALESLLAVDEAIGSEPQYGITGLLEELSNLGVERDTIIVYMTDNGYAWGEHRFTQKTRVYEEQIRTPFFVRYPRLVPLARVDSSIVANIDIAPTFTELAGVTPPDAVDGRSFVRVLDGTEAAWRDHLLVQGFNAPVGSEYAAVVDGTRKYVECAPGDREYYDLTVDPDEMTSAHNAPQNAAITTTMAAQIRQIRPTWPSDVP
jgi:arylsulfatase A-like enzyme